MTTITHLNTTDNRRRLFMVVGAVVIWLLWGDEVRKSEIQTTKPGEVIRVTARRVAVVRKPTPPIQSGKRDIRPEPLFRVPDEVISDYVPPEGRVEIKPEPDGTSEVHVVSSGFTFKPGIYWFPEQHGGVDAKVYFKGRYGFNLGGDWDFRRHVFDVGPSLSVHPNLRFVSNLEVALGYSLIQKKLWLGLRINL